MIEMVRKGLSDVVTSEERPRERKRERERERDCSCRGYSEGTRCLVCWRSSKEVWMLKWNEQGASWRKVGQRSKSKLVVGHKPAPCCKGCG